MALTLILTPELPFVLQKIKEAFEDIVYDRSTTAVPNFKEFTLNGSGAVSGEVLSIEKNQEVVGMVTAHSDGTFAFTLTPLYDRSNSFQAIGPTSGSSNFVVFDVYNFLNVVYVLSKEVQAILEGVAQAKQNIYVQGKVGDTVEPNFETGQDTYETPDVLLKDKMPFDLPSEFWSGTLEDLTQESIELAEKGLVWATFLGMKEVFSGAGVTDVFMWSQENFEWLNLETDELPYVDTGDATKLKVPFIEMRRGWAVEYVKAQDLDVGVALPGPPGSFTYAWVYVDGTKDPDETLTVFISEAQPLPKLITTEKTIALADVKTDDSSGTITDIPYQKYVELDPPAFGLSYTLSVKEGALTLLAPRLINRSILALGEANVVADVDVTYTYHSESFILCVVELDSSNNIVDLFNLESVPGQLGPDAKESWGDLGVFFKFSTVPSAQIIQTIKEILSQVNPISHPLHVFATSVVDDQAVVTEGSVDWGWGGWKGFKWVGIA